MNRQEAYKEHHFWTERFEYVLICIITLGFAWALKVIIQRAILDATHTNSFKR